MQRTNIVGRGLALAVMLALLQGAGMQAQTLGPAATDGVAAWTRQGSAVRRPPPAWRARRLAPAAPSTPAPARPYFLEIAMGVDSGGSGPFVSAGIHVDDSLALVVETAGGRDAVGEAPATGRAPQAFLDSPRSWPSKPAACPRVRASAYTYMAGMQFRIPTPRFTPFVQVLGGQASTAAVASEPGDGGVETSCYELFGSGRAVAAGGGVDVRLGRRFRLRFIADYRRLAVPGLEGLETVLTERDGDSHLRLARVGVAFVIGIL